MTQNYNENGTYEIQTEDGLTIEYCRTKFYARSRIKQLKNEMKCELYLKTNFKK